MKKILLQNAFPPVDEDFERGMNRAFMQIKEEQRMKRRQIPRRAALLAAIIMLFITAVGFATGLFTSIFDRMTNDGFTGDPTTDYAKLNQMSVQSVSGQRITFQNGASADVKLEQSYYNGEQLIIGWSYRALADSEYYERGDARFADVHPIETVSEDGRTTVREDINVEAYFAPAIVKEIFDRVMRDGWAGIYWNDVWLGDGAYQKDVPGEDASVRLFSDVDRSWRVAGAGQRYTEFETPLPESARGIDALSVMCKFYLRPTWYCFEKTSENGVDTVSAYIGYGDTLTEEVLFHVPRSGEYTEKAYSTEANFPNHTATLSVVTTPVYARYEIVNRVPQEWEDAWSNYAGYLEPPLQLPVDAVFDYEVWIERGGVLEAIDTVRSLSYGGVSQVSGQFVIPDGASALVFRPVYANTGAHPEEDVRIQLEIR